MDPVVHMMFKAVAGRLAEINSKINDISDTIINDLACRIFFDGLLHPIPASTVLKFTTGGSTTNVNILTEAYWVNTSIQPSVTFYFSPIEPKELHPVEAVFVLSVTSEGVKTLWTNPQWNNKGEFLGHFESTKTPAESIEKDRIYIGLKPMGRDIKVPTGEIFIQTSAELLEILRWSRWRFTESPGIFGEPVVPGQEKIKNIWDKRANPVLSLWGHNYYPYEHKEEYQKFFYDIKQGAAGSAPEQLIRVFPDLGGGQLSDLGPLYWIQIESDKSIPAKELKNFELAATNCVLGLNAHYLKQNYFYRGPGPMDISPQNKASEIYEITALDDNHGRGYDNIYASSGNGRNQCYYVPRIDGNIFSLVVVPPENETIPDRFSLEYRISSGEDANGISAGLINSLYNPLPGIESVINLTTTKGGTSARSFNDMLKVFPNVLRSYNRAVVPSDFESLALSFDKRIISAKARTGSTEREGILRGCIELELDLGTYKFKLADEGSLFLSRLARFLEMRSPIGTIVNARFSG